MGNVLGKFRINLACGLEEFLLVNAENDRHLENNPFRGGWNFFIFQVTQVPGRYTDAAGDFPQSHPGFEPAFLEDSSEHAFYLIEQGDHVKLKSEPYFPNGSLICDGICFSICLMRFSPSS